MTLAEIQQRFQRALAGDMSAVAGLIEGDAERGIAIHRHNIESSLVQVLVDAFPAVRRILGGRAFLEAARGFVADSPPRLPVLAAYGAVFADFLAAEVARLPYLADVARLEWARQEAVGSPDAAPLPAHELNGLDEDEAASLALVLHPAARMVMSPFPVFRIWALNQEDGVDIPAVDMSVAEAVVITRPRFDLLMRRIDPADAVLLAALDAGQTLSAATQEAKAVDPTYDLTAALAAHLASGTFSERI